MIPHHENFIRIGRGVTREGQPATEVFLARRPVTWGDWKDVTGRPPPDERLGPDQPARFPVGAWEMTRFLGGLNERDKHLGVAYRIPTLAELLMPYAGIADGISEFRATEEYKKLLAWCWDIDQGDTWTFPWSARSENGGPPTVKLPGFESFLGKSWEAASEVVSMFRNITDGYVESEGLFLCNGDDRTPVETLGRGYPILRAMYQPEIDTICFRLCAEVPLP